MYLDQQKPTRFEQFASGLSGLEIKIYYVFAYKNFEMITQLYKWFPLKNIKPT